MRDFSGTWQSTFGPMELVQTGTQVEGSYVYLGTTCTLAGRVAAGRLTFTYQEPDIHGEGWFELARQGRAFAGQFRPAGAERWEPWEGERIGFDGLWNSSFGLLRLLEDEDTVRGYYEEGGGASLRGRRRGDRLVFSYREPTARGQGRFVLAPDGLSFQGEWRPRGDTTWRPWSGIRVRPQPHLTWLVVVEAPWQRFLSDREYSFGSMLREFFARIPNVQVRHRFFTNEAGLRRSCRDLLYIAEPVVLVVATHARPEGITVDGQVIGAATLAEALRDVANLRLLHFSACLLLQDPAAVAPLRELSHQADVPVSGYSTSVDWAASAIIEFTLLDLILTRGLPPAAAAEELVRLLPFAGSEGVAEGTYPAAGFTMLLPERATGGAPAARPRRRRPRRPA